MRNMETSKVIDINQPVETTRKPEGVGNWSLAEISKSLSRRPLPKSMLGTKKKGGKTLEFIPWHRVVTALDKYAPGWDWEIRQIHTSDDRIFITGRLTIAAADGTFYREAMGSECLKEEVPVKISDGEKTKTIADELGRIVTESRELAYGDPASKAESMALRRAAAKFGLGLYLYEK